MEDDNKKDVVNAPREEKQRVTPRVATKDDSRDRTSELPADDVSPEEIAKKAEAANGVANQTIDEGNENEVQGKAAVPSVKVMKRGSTKWTDEDGVVHKELNSAEPNVEIAKDEVPEYLELHQRVLDGEDPLKATLDFQGRDEKEAFSEGKLKNAEEHPRTGGLGTATPRREETSDDR